MAIQRALGTPAADSTNAQNPNRAGSYLEAYTLPLVMGYSAFADEGSFFTATNATVGTGIAGHAAPVVADNDTKALLHLYNGGQKNIIPVFLHLAFTAIGAGGTVSYNVAYTDNASATARTSGGTQITPQSCKSSGASTTGATVYFGAVVTSMTSSRKLFSLQCREVIPVVNDTMSVFFGAAGASIFNGLTAAGTATNNLIQMAPPVVIAPGGNFNFARIRPSQSGADSYTFTFGYIER